MPSVPRCFLLAIIPILTSYIVWWTFNKIFPQLHIEQLCWKDLYSGEHNICRPKCNHGYFSLPGMYECHPWLRCQDMNDVKITQEIVGTGAVKVAHLAKWKDHTVIRSNMLSPAYHQDFHHGLSMLAGYQPHPRFVQLIGFCHHSIVTEYYRFKSANYLNEILAQDRYKKYNTLRTRFQLCLDYTEILSHLHHGPLGTRVMCDSNSLEKTLDQYLLTDDLRLIVNDLDALPKVSECTNIKCGHREMFGEFVAPEQLWPHEDKVFIDSLMPGYNEKTDIWKVPDVCDYLLGEYPETQSIKFHLFQIHQECKNIQPELRPTALQISETYHSIWREFKLQNNTEILTRS